eukprot:scaffold257548_cov28-Tisochrysis_lutea.AAC.4
MLILHGGLTDNVGAGMISSRVRGGRGARSGGEICAPSASEPALATQKLLATAGTAAASGSVSSRARGHPARSPASGADPPRRQLWARHSTTGFVLARCGALGQHGPICRTGHRPKKRLRRRRPRPDCGSLQQQLRGYGGREEPRCVLVEEASSPTDQSAHALIWPIPRVLLLHRGLVSTLRNVPGIPGQLHVELAHSTPLSLRRTHCAAHCRVGGGQRTSWSRLSSGRAPEPQE